MKTEIKATVSGVIQLDAAEQFDVVGADEFGSPEYKVRVERVHDWAGTYPMTRGVKFSGRRILKDGSTNYQNRKVVMDDGDERIPEAIATAVAEMRKRLDHLRAYVAEEA